MGARFRIGRAKTAVQPNKVSQSIKARIAQPARMPFFPINIRLTVNLPPGPHFTKVDFNFEKASLPIRCFPSRSARVVGDNQKLARTAG